MLEYSVQGTANCIVHELNKQIHTGNAVHNESSVIGFYFK